MTELTIDKRDLERLIDCTDASPKILREAKRRAFEASAPRLRALLDKGFIRAKVYSREKAVRTGAVLSWQEQYVGSGGGYAAVRPKENTFTPTNGRGKKYAVGHVTNAIESGHRFRPPEGEKKRYRPRVKSAAQKVRPYAFYDAARAEVSALARETADQILKALIKHLEEL